MTIQSYEMEIIRTMKVRVNFDDGLPDGTQIAVGQLDEVAEEPGICVSLDSTASDVTGEILEEDTEVIGLRKLDEEHQP